MDRYVHDRAVFDNPIHFDRVADLRLKNYFHEMIMINAIS